MQNEPLIQSVRTLAFKRKLRRESVRYTRVALTNKVRAFIADPRNHEYCVPAPEGSVGANIRDAHDQFYEAARDFDFPALLAALERAERIEKAAKRCDFEVLALWFDKEQRAGRWGGVHGSHEVQRNIRALDAALSEPQ